MSAPPARTGAPADAGARPQDEPERTILVVDDIPLLRDLVADMLAGRGRVLQAGDGGEALATARAERPDLIVADLDMPGTNGAALCRAVRADAALAATPFLMLLPGDDARDRVRAIRAGADDVVTKPIQRPELLLCAGRFLARPAARGLPRVAVDTPVTIFLAGGHERARAVNLSRGGMFVRTELPLPHRSEWRLRFELPDGQGSIAPTAMVVWRAGREEPTGPGLGLRFVELDGASARHLDEYVYERTPSSWGAAPPRP